MGHAKKNEDEGSDVVAHELTPILILSAMQLRRSLFLGYGAGCSSRCTSRRGAGISIFLSRKPSITAW